MGVFECVCAPAFKRNRYLSSLTDTMKMSDKLFGGGMSSGPQHGQTFMNE